MITLPNGGTHIKTMLLDGHKRIAPLCSITIFFGDASTKSGDMQLSTFIMISEAVGLKFALTY